MSTPAPIPTAPVENFARAIADAGIEPPDEIIADGGVHRFPTNGKRGDDAGWYVLHSDGIPAGAFGDWRSDVTKTWCARRIESLSPAEREEHRRRIEAARREAEAERARAQEEAAKRAAELWARAKPETGEHRYLRDKRVQAHGIRTDGERLLIPMRDAEGKPWNIQRIAQDGTKRFLPGGRTKGLYFGIGRPDGVLVIAEGYTTGASVHEATGHAVAVAFSAANLRAVAEALRKKLGPDVRLIIAGDNDASGTGQKAATEAACAVGGLVAIPAKGDWNDVAKAEDPEAVRKGIESAGSPSGPDSAAEEWPTLIPLESSELPRLDDHSLPAWAGDFARALADHTETPLELAAGMVLASCSVATARRLRVMVKPGYFEPCNLWWLVALPSGSRKSAVQKFATDPLLAWEHDQAVDLEPEIKRLTSERRTMEERIKVYRRMAAAPRKNGPNPADPEECARKAAELEAELPEIPTPRNFGRPTRRPRSWESCSPSMASVWPGCRRRAGFSTCWAVATRTGCRTWT